MSKLDRLLEIEDMEYLEALEKYTYESVVPGICMTKNCDNTEDVEPDSETG